MKPLSEDWFNIEKPVMNPESVIQKPELQGILEEVWSEMKGTKRVMEEYQEGLVA